MLLLNTATLKSRVVYLIEEGLILLHCVKLVDCLHRKYLLPNYTLSLLPHLLAYNADYQYQDQNRSNWDKLKA